MKYWKKPTSEMVEKTLSLVRKETDRRFFFSRLKNPMWIQPLAEKGYFQSPPTAIRSLDNSDLFPFWPEFQYLKNVCVAAPEKVIELILKLPKVDNPTICNDILDIALQLPGEQSVKLKPKILECTDAKIEFSGHKYIDLLIQWHAENQTSDALALLKTLVNFEPDPQAKEKIESRKNYAKSSAIPLSPLLTPSPRFDDWEYREIMDKGVRPLAEKEPLSVARILIDAAASMIRMTMDSDDTDETQGVKRYKIWSDRALDMSDQSHPHYLDSKDALVQEMKFSCEKVFEKSPELVVLLNETLCNQRWEVFRHIREHLYELYPNEQTKPWIQELILTHKNYDRKYPYHFQKMLRSACGHFGAQLLSEEERARIFEAICNSPSQESFKKRREERFTEEEFKKDQRQLHRLLLRPFASVLFGEHLSYYEELEDESEEELSDKDYLSFRSYGGTVRQRSPKPLEELAKMTDEDLLDYINEWNDNHHDEKDPLVDINIEALAREFGNVFEKFIMSNPERLKFWTENRAQIQRPIYLRSMVDAMHEQVKAKNFDNLGKWLSFCEWILSYYDRSVEKVAKDEQKYESSDELEEDPDWHNPRLAVGNFVETCFKEEVDAPISHQKSLAKLLEMLCTQFDWGLDQGKLLHSNLMDEAINNIRSNGLETLVKFGFWVRRHDEKADVSEVTTILQKRFALATERPLTLPEYAILGAEYPRIYFLDQTWAMNYKLDFFPIEKRKERLAAFGSFVHWHRPWLPIFEFLREEFVFALENLKDLEADNSAGENLIDVIGQKLFTYYLWGVYPLSGEESLIARYYQKTTRKCWERLFTWVGFVLRNHDGKMEEKLVDRFKEFFEWRLKARETVELGKFFLWMEAECLEAEWRLDACSRLLEFIDSVDGKDSDDSGRVFNALRGLRGMLGKHTAKVVECFAKMTDIAIKNNSTYFYITLDDAKPILKAGLESKDEIVRENAKQSQENLLKMGRFEFLNLDE